MFSKRKITEAFRGGANDGIGSSVTRKITAIQHKAADYLSKKTAGWSPLKMKIVLILFCLVTGNISLYIAGRAILSANGPPRSFKVQRLHLPFPLQKDRPNSLSPDSSTNKLYHKNKINNDE